ncbi:MAG: DUF1571 domain-containing protein [Phycisphaerae bacterium]
MTLNSRSVVGLTILFIAVFEPGCSTSHPPAVSSSAPPRRAAEGVAPPAIVSHAAPETPTAPRVTPPAPLDEDGIQRDPVGYLRHCSDAAARLGQYRVTFERQERLGFPASLRARERIAAVFRNQPFSVYFRWIDRGSEYAQASFIQGRNNDKVLLLPRRGFLGLPPSVSKFGVQDGVTFQKTRNPITDFGVARMMERTLERLERAGTAATVAYSGLADAGETGRRGRKFELTFPRSDPFPNKRMELFIDPQTHVPIGTWLFLPDGRLDAMYVYNEIDPGVQLSDADFDIRPAERPAKSAGKQARAGGAGRSTVLAPSEQ